MCARPNFKTNAIWAVIYVPETQTVWQQPFKLKHETCKNLFSHEFAHISPLTRSESISVEKVNSTPVRNDGNKLEQIMAINQMCSIDLDKIKTKKNRNHLNEFNNSFDSHFFSFKKIRSHFVVKQLNWLQVAHPTRIHKQNAQIPKKNRITRERKRKKYHICRRFFSLSMKVICFYSLFPFEFNLGQTMANIQCNKTTV